MESGSRHALRDTSLSELRRARARVPATTANLGPGFDALGLALDLHEEVILERLDGDERPRVRVTGLNASRLRADTNLLAYLEAVRF